MVKEFLSASSLATYGQPLTSLPAPETPHTEMRHVIAVFVLFDRFLSEDHVLTFS